HTPPGEGAPLPHPEQRQQVRAALIVVELRFRPPQPVAPRSGTLDEVLVFPATRASREGADVTPAVTLSRVTREPRHLARLCWNRGGISIASDRTHVSARRALAHSGRRVQFGEADRDRANSEFRHLLR